MILVTGGTGLVGSHLLLELAQAGEKLRAIHRKSSNFRRVKKVFAYGRSKEEAERLFASIEWTEADVMDVPALEEAFEGVTTVYHCAALISFDPSDSKKLRKMNIEGTANVVNFCIKKRVKKLCFLSSIATLDVKVGEKTITENSHWNKELDHSMYAISKYGAEMEVWRASQEGVPIIILNPGIIIGPGFWNSGSGIMFKKVGKGLKYSFPKVTGFVGVWDVVKAMRLVMSSPVKNNQYLLVSENLSFRNVLKQIANSLGKSTPKKQLKPWMVFLGWVFESIGKTFGGKQRLTRQSIKGLFSESYYDSSKIKEEFGFEFENIDKVIERTGREFREQTYN